MTLFQKQARSDDHISQIKRQNKLLLFRFNWSIIRFQYETLYIFLGRFTNLYHFIETLLIIIAIWTIYSCDQMTIKGTDLQYLYCTYILLFTLYMYSEIKVIQWWNCVTAWLTGYRKKSLHIAHENKRYDLHFKWQSIFLKSRPSNMTREKEMWPFVVSVIN